MAAVCLAATTVLSGCNGIGSKDSLLARFDDESVYDEDIVFLDMNSNNSRQSKKEAVYEKIYSKAAVASRAKKEFPGIEAEWDEYYKELDPRILMVIYQRFFVSERMTYSDSELRRFYDANRGMFPEGDSGSYFKVRGDVASLYHASKNPEKFAEFLDGLKNKSETIDTLAQKRSFAEMHRQELRDSIMKDIREKQHISVQSLPPVDPKAYYEKNKDKYMTVPGFVLYHVQMEDSSALAAKVKEGMSLEQFKQVAATISTNKLTAKDSGLVGMVKKYYALPYGIGMIESLSDALDGKEPGFISPIFRSGSSFQRFYLAENVASQVKPYDRVAKKVEMDAASGETIDVDSSFVLLMQDGKTLYTEGDLLRFVKRYYGGRPLNGAFHDRLLNMMADTYAFASAAMENKVNHSWEYRAAVRSARWDFVFDKYVEKKRGADQVPEDSLKSLYKRLGAKLHAGRTYEQIKDELAQVLSIPKTLYDHEYLLGYRLLYKDMTYDESVPQIFFKLKNEINGNFANRVAAESFTQASTHFYKPDPYEFSPVMVKEKLLPRADSLYKAGERSKAYMEYRRALFAFADDDSLFQKIAYELALVQNDNDEFLDAEAEYYAFYRMWPDNENAEKAMFSRGFILTENLKKDSVALDVFHEFLEKYPNSELKESAEWLVKNIESNGKMTEDLLKKIGEEQ